VEWLSGTNPNQANAPKTLSAMSFVPPSATKAGEPSSGFYQMSLERPKEVRGATVVIESSTDLKTWTVIPATDPQWQVIDDSSEPQIRVMSKTAQLTQKRYFRAKYNYTGS
jgi:hypothetical protein